MFRSTLKLPLETPNHLFIIPTTLKYIQPFLKIVGYQGIVDKVSAFYMNNLAQPWQKMFKVFNCCLTSRTSGHDHKKINILQIFHAVINRVHVDYADLLWWDFLHCVQQKKDVIQHPRFTKLIIADLMKNNSTEPRITKIAKIAEEQENMAAVEKHKLAEDMEKLVEGKDEESYPSKFADFVFLDDKDTGNRIEPRSHKENPEIVDDDDDEEEEEKKDDEKDDVNDDNDNDDYDDQALVRNKKMGSSEDKNEKMQIPIPSPPRSPSIDLSLDKNISQELMTIVSPTPATTSQDRSKSKHISSKYKHITGAIHRICRRQYYMIKQMEKKFVTNREFQGIKENVDRVLHEIIPQIA
ncbi:hypothetical protein Tco_0407484 [Tanacetum coccineum]